MWGFAYLAKDVSGADPKTASARLEKTKTIAKQHDHTTRTEQLQEGSSALLRR